MGKVITVWGSPGSGKSMFCCILAKALTRDKRKAIIINADMNVPMLPVWLPEQIIQTNTSIGQVLSSVEIDTSLVASHVTVLKNYPFIGMMGYAAGENPLSYPEVKYTMVLQLIHAAAKLVDFVILDCSTSMTNVFTPAAIEAGDVVIRILTPDLKGINYLKAHQPLLVDERFRFSEHMTFAGLARPFHALDEMGYIIGGFDGLLPYSKEIDRCATEGGMFKAITYCNPKYTASLNKVLEILEQMELAEQSEDDAAYECEEDLPEDEFYDVVVFAYLKAVKDYFNSPSAQKFSFSTIATRQMKFRLYDYFRTQERRKRNMEVLSIHVGLYPDGAPLEDTIPAHDPIMQQLEMDLLLHELAGRVSKQQMDIVHLKQGGYGIREIARTQKVPMRRIKELLAEVHDVLLDICYG